MPGGATATPAGLTPFRAGLLPHLALQVLWRQDGRGRVPELVSVAFSGGGVHQRAGMGRAFERV